MFKFNFKDSNKLYLSYNILLVKLELQFKNSFREL